MQSIRTKAVNCKYFFTTSMRLRSILSCYKACGHFDPPLGCREPTSAATGTPRSSKHSSLVSSLPLNSASSSFRPSPAANIPPELINRVLLFLTHDTWNNERFPGKTGLANASLVCRYWEKTVRSVLFWQLTLRSPEDVNQLLDFINYGIRSNLHHDIHHIIYHKSDHHIPPWIRLHTLLAHLRKDTYFTFEVGGPNDPPRAIHGDTILRCLPRTLPPSALPRAGHTFIYSTVFRNTVDFSRFVYAFRNPSISHHVERVEFATLPSQTLMPQFWTRSQPRIAVHRPGSLDGTFAGGLKNALALGFVQRRLMIEDDRYELIQETLSSLIPPEWIIESLRTDEPTFRGMCDETPCGRANN